MKEPAVKKTPMIKQYLSIKQNYADAILFYRMGDFYEMFFEDAEIASRLLEITLTSRNKKAEEPIKMCGFPVRAVEGYIARLIDHGHKVAICEQIEDPAAAKGIVKRDVVRIITPGMILDDNFLDARSNNYILSIASAGNHTGLAYLDISTGTFRVTETANAESSAVDPVIVDEVLRIAPSEVVLAKASQHHPFFHPLINVLQETAHSFLDNSDFQYRSAREKLVDQFKTRSLEGFGCEHLEAGVAAAGALLSYVQETQKQAIGHLTGIETYSLSDHLLIDEMSCRNLELVSNLRSGGRKGTLLGIIDHTVTAMGGRLLKKWVRYPLIDINAIRSRLDAVEEAGEQHHLRKTIRQLLKSVSDLERLGSKITMGRANARDLLALKRSLQVLPEIWSELSTFQADLFDRADDLTALNALADRIEQSIRDDAPQTLNEGNIFKQGYSDELDELIHISRDAKGWLAKLEVQEREKTGISTLKVKYNKVFGYFIEVSKAASAAVPDDYIRKQTLVNAERYITEELKDFESRVLSADERRTSLEYELFNELRGAVIDQNRAILTVARFLAELDCLLNLADIAEHNNYCRPEINTRGEIIIEEGRHPVVEKMITGERYVPNTIRIDDEASQVLVITGPNMAGKSTVLRQVALTVLLAHMGAFVPAARASISITDRVFTRVGALDNLSQGQSTFMVEMEETANIMNNATCRSLIIMDEIGRGTSTFDGMSIAWAVAEYLHDLEQKGVKTLFATHYHELTELSQIKPRVKNFNIAVKEHNDHIIFLRKLVEGGTNRSYGIQVARLAGVPDPVIRRAKTVLSEIERDHEIAASVGIPDQADTTDEAVLPQDAVQLNLFDSNADILHTTDSVAEINAASNENTDRIIEQLNTVDIAVITPLEALNLLNELKNKAKTVSIR